jgi:NADH:ubiquinone oxidoreductase subunit F (NADH-binding)
MEQLLATREPDSGDGTRGLRVPVNLSAPRGDRACGAGSLGVSTEPGPARLLAELGHSGSWRTLAEHRARYAAPPAAGSQPWQNLIDAVHHAGLRGRGGAGFPTSRKLAAVASAAGRKVVVANGTEGEPASAKDRLLVTRMPHLVIDGALLAAAAVGADEVFLCIDRTRTASLASLRHALEERDALEPRSSRVHVAATPPRFVAGEETALVNWLNGSSSRPTFAPPRPFERGVARRPTLVQNVETLAHLAQIAAFGPDWFRQVGVSDEPGTSLFTVSGAVPRPCVLEAAVGTPVRNVLRSAGGSGEQTAAVLVGGFFGVWVASSQLSTMPLSRTALGHIGASPGAGVLVALPQSACGLAETAQVLAWYAGESAGQCGPCAFGLPDLARVTAKVAAGAGSAADVERLWRWAGDIEGRGACRHPDGAVRLLRSALTVFAEDLDRHLRGRPCDGAAQAAALSVPASTREWR